MAPASPLDRWPARIAAVLIAVAGLALMGWLGRDELSRGTLAFSGGGTPVAGSAVDSAPANPRLDACLSERVGAVDKMREEGIVTPAQYDTFRARAVAFCEAEFPPQR
ncbi:hypothetical protein H2509_01655 [Stappia sp. F7233]|uniref:Uncharacterized protein n=1 Tax=Stappia albiluteola TaxID=2758565 RepID=A0A839A9F0_9HYPH|nr:hypothetical protein [Stappia albiluteola]MBA5775826.1 hypothetical protein [Stappia albiluteola]